MSAGVVVRLSEGPPAGIPTEIVCVDCGGRCHLLSHVPEEGFAAGDVVAYRCADCLDRWDIVLDEEDLAES
jgi:hypothetical protein